jgi:Bacteriophage head to tail connecting protein
MRTRDPSQAQEIASRVIDRYNSGIQYAANFRQRIDLLAPYVEATRSNVVSGQAPGQALLSRMYDSEGISSADLAVRQIGSYLHGPGSQWFGLEDENEMVNQEDEAREWYEDCRDRMLKMAAGGGFYPESYESDMDWAIFGTGHMRVEKRPTLPYESPYGFQGIRFNSFKAGRLVVFENGRGEIDEDYAEIKKTAKAAADLWGLENLPDNMKEAYTNGKADEFCFIHGIYARTEKDKMYGNKAMPFSSCIVEKQSRKLVYESGYDEFPDVVNRWSRCWGEPYGRGLGEIALNTLITLNAAVKHDLEAMALRIKPPLAQRHDSVIGDRKFSPWGVTIVRLASGEALQNAIAPIVTSNGNYSFTQIDAKALKDQIRRMFYADVLEQLMALEGQQEMRVYVFQQKQNIVQKLLGPTYGRWESEFGIPWVARVFNLMLRENAFAPVPDVILQLGGQPKVRFESPLARAQRSEQIDSMNEAVQDLNPVIQMQINEWKMTGKQPDQWVLDGYDFDKYRDKVNQNRGVPATVTLGTKQIMAIRKSRAEAAAQAAQAQQAMQLAQGLGKAAPMVSAMGQAQ